MITASLLTPEQRRIVERGDGPVVVIAGAGTGKTRVVAKRVRWLLATKGAPDNPDPLLSRRRVHLRFDRPRGDPPPTREDLERGFRARWTPTGFGDKTTEEGYQRRVATLLDNFWQGDVSSLSEALHEELDFELTLEPDDGSAPVVITGSIDRIDRLPSGGIEVIDYKTDERVEHSIYALACRDALGLGTPERVTLYFTESATKMTTTRSDYQLEHVRDEILDRVREMRGGVFLASPGRQCAWCDYRLMCPSAMT